MARLTADENFPFPVTEALRNRGHDVVTVQELGLAHRGTPDSVVLAHATADGRSVVTFDRRDYRRLHQQNPTHAGIIVPKDDSDVEALADRIHAAITALPDLTGRFVRVTRSTP